MNEMHSKGMQESPFLNKTVLWIRYFSFENSGFFGLLLNIKI